MGKMPPEFARITGKILSALVIFAVNIVDLHIPFFQGQATRVYSWNISYSLDDS